MNLSHHGLRAALSAYVQPGKTFLTSQVALRRQTGTQQQSGLSDQPLMGRGAAGAEAGIGAFNGIEQAARAETLPDHPAQMASRPSARPWTLTQRFHAIAATVAPATAGCRIEMRT